ncbi:MAG: autotransporter-associated beta strand repeat-containing protein [Tepidisphaeraceae bacterium]
MQSGALVSPGSYTTSSSVVTRGVGTLTVGDLNLSAGSILDYDFAGASNDLINVSFDSTLAYGATGLLTINGGGFNLFQANTSTAFAANGTYNLIQYSGTIAGTGISALSVLNPVANKTYTFGDAGGFVTLSIGTVGVTTNEWKDLDGNWTTGSNWTLGTAPNAAGAIAQFGGGSINFTGPRSVNLNAGQTVGTVAFNSAQSVTINGTNTLTLDGNGESAFITNALGTHEIKAPIHVASSAGLSVGVVGVSDVTTLSGAIDGTTSLVKTGSGKLILAADNTYVGDTAINSGIVQLGNGGAAGSLGTGNISVGGSLVVNRNNSLTIASNISGTGSVSQSGTGTLVLSGTNTYTGATTVNAGTLSIGSTQALQSSTLNYSAGTVNFVNGITAATVAAISGSGNLALTNDASGAVALSLGGTGASSTYSGVLSGAGSVAKSGGGTLTLSGVSTYTGNTSITGGAIVVGTGGALNGGGAMTISAGITGLNVTGGVVNLGALSVNTSNASSNYGVRVTAGGNATFTSINSGRMSINTGGAEPTAGDTGSGFIVNDGTLNVTGNFGLGSANGSNSGTSMLISGGLVNSTVNVGGVLTIGAGSGRWTIVDVNAATLNVTDATSGINLGGVQAGKNKLLLHNGFIAGSALVNAGAITFGTPSLDASAVSNAGLVQMDDGMLNIGAGGIKLNTASPTYVASVLMNGGTLGALADWTGNVPMTINGGIIRADDGAATPVAHDITLSGVVNGGVIEKQGAGSLILTGANTYVGGTNIHAGKVVGGGHTALSTGPVTIDAGATLAVQTGYSDALVLTGIPTIAVGAKVDVSDSGLVIDYSGSTVIDTIRTSAASGALMSSRTLSDSRIKVGYIEASLITTGGTGTFRNVTVDDTAILIRAVLGGDTNIDGTVNFADLLALAANYNSTTGIWQKGDFNYDGNVNFSDLLSLASNYNQTVTGSFAGDWALAQSVVPEPTTLAALTLGAGTLLVRRRRAH